MSSTVRPYIFDSRPPILSAVHEGTVPETLLLDITIVLLLGVGAQWMARRFHLPALLLLLVGGFVAGPVFGLLSPEALQANWFYGFVSLSAGLLLFEAGLNLRFSTLTDVKPPVFRVLLLGGLISWGLGASAAHYILGFEVGLSILLGILLSIAGPAVTVPFLRHVRPNSRVGTLTRWEGWTAEPLRAILAVLVLDALLLLNRPIDAGAELSSIAEQVAVGIGLDIFIALGVSVAATALLVVLFQRRSVPNVLRSPAMLVVVLAAFVVSNVLQDESGFLAATFIGLLLANQPYVAVQRSFATRSFRTFLVGALFVLLSAKLDLSALDMIDVRMLVFLAFLVVLVRPLAVFASTLGTNLEWEEKTFLAWLSPPGGLAAVLATLFAHRLLPMYPQDIPGLVPTVLTTIVGVVALYGLTLGPLAQWLGVATPNPQGILFIGAAPWVRKLARRVQQLGVPVSLLDTHPQRVRQAQEADLPARQTRRLSEAPHDDLDLSHMGRLFIAVPHDEVAARTAQHFSDVFDSGDIYHLPAQRNDRQGKTLTRPAPAFGRPAFGESTTYTTIVEHMKRGGEIKILKVADDLPENEHQESYTYEELAGQYEEHMLIPFFIIRGPNSLEVVSTLHQFSLQPEDRLVALVSTAPKGSENGVPSTSAEKNGHPPALAIEDASTEKGEDASNA